MRYNGGKKRIGKQLSEIINKTNPQVYWEPFCGMCSVGLNVTAPVRYFSDADEAAIAVLKAVVDGYEFPTSLSEEEYHAAKKLPPSNPLHGFAKYGCSFGGIGGYAKDAKGTNYALVAKRSLLKMKNLEGVDICHKSASEKSTPPSGTDTIYLDPPYKGTAAVGAKINQGDWFWPWAENLSKTANVFVSEYEAPLGWICVFEKKTGGMRLTSGREKKPERLFVHEDNLARINASAIVLLPV